MHATEFARAIEPWSVGKGGNITSHLALSIRHAIGAGLLTTGERLPPERELAEALSVSRPTISAVMNQLRSSGLVTSRQGSGTWVAEAAVPPSIAVPFAERLMKPGLIDLAAATAPDASSLPEFRVESTDLLSAEPANGLNPVGLPALRDSIAERVRVWAPSVDRENVIVTSGAHQALALVVAALVPRGATVLVESVTYGGLVDIIEANGARVIGIERDEAGPIPSSLRALLRRHQPALTVLVASVHSPTASVSSEERSLELAKVLASGPSRVVIDETYADLDFTLSPRTLTTALGNEAILVGSLSKSAWLGLRTGWIVAPPDKRREIVRRRWAQFDLGPSVPSQLFALEVLKGLDARLVKRRAALLERAQWLTDALHDSFPEWDVFPVQGGLALWARLPVEDSNVFVDRAAEMGVALMPGSACRADRGTDSHVRICFDRPSELLQEALDRMVK